MLASFLADFPMAGCLATGCKCKLIAKYPKCSHVTARRKSNVLPARSAMGSASWAINTLSEVNFEWALTAG